MKQKVLLLGKVVHALAALDSLKRWGDIITPRSSTREEFIQECKEGRFEDVVIIYRTYYSVSITGVIDEELLQVLPPSLKFVCHSGSGYEQIDTIACFRRRIRVSNVPSVVDDATADATMFLILGALRGFNLPLLCLREGTWRGDLPLPLGNDPRGKTLGIIGMGGVGRSLKRKADGFGMNTIYHNRNRLAETEGERAKYVAIDVLLSESDVISIHVPLTVHTRHMISKSQFDQMKNGVIIVNTSRGPVIDENALVDALQTGKVKSCGLDVFEDEPVVHPGLLANRQVILLPHLGTYTVETHASMEERCLANVRMALEYGKLADDVESH